MRKELDKNESEKDCAAAYDSAENLIFRAELSDHLCADRTVKPL